MLHQQIRQARQAARLSQRELAQRAGVPRSQLQKLEDGGNVTVETLTKIASALPDLGVLNNGPLKMEFNADANAFRDALLDIIRSATRMVELMGGTVPAEGGRGGAEAEREFTPHEIARARELEPERLAMRKLVETLHEDDDAS